MVIRAVIVTRVRIVSGEMTTSELLRSEYIGIREFREHCGKYILGDETKIITLHGKPKMVLVSYKRMAELITNLQKLREK